MDTTRDPGDILLELGHSFHEKRSCITKCDIHDVLKIALHLGVFGLVRFISANFINITDIGERIGVVYLHSCDLLRTAHDNAYSRTTDSEMCDLFLDKVCEYVTANQIWPWVLMGMAEALSKELWLKLMEMNSNSVCVWGPLTGLFALLFPSSEVDLFERMVTDWVKIDSEEGHVGENVIDVCVYGERVVEVVHKRSRHDVWRYYLTEPNLYLFPGEIFWQEEIDDEENPFWRRLGLKVDHLGVVLKEMHRELGITCQYQVS
jgi:hypothetical protein